MRSREWSQPCCFPCKAQMDMALLMEGMHPSGVRDSRALPVYKHRTPTGHGTRPWHPPGCCRSVAMNVKLHCTRSWHARGEGQSSKRSPQAQDSRITDCIRFNLAESILSDYSSETFQGQITYSD